jgi:hypothetical protein
MATMIPVPNTDSLAMVTYWVGRRYGTCEDGCGIPAEYIVIEHAGFYGNEEVEVFICALCAARRASQGETIIPANDEAVNQMSFEERERFIDKAQWP